jgi:hypothetical protein
MNKSCSRCALHLCNQYRKYLKFSRYKENPKGRCLPEIEVGLYQIQHGQIYMMLLQFLVPKKQNVKK